MAKQGFVENHWLDENSNPAGGCSFGVGFAVSWQNGPLGRDGQRVAPNGAFVEDVIAAVIGRIEFYERSRFSCKENKEALRHLYEAARWLDSRTKAREAQSVEGTHAVHANA